MNEKVLMQLWQSTNKKLEDSIAINKKNTEAVTKLKAKDFLSSMKPVKLLAIITGIIWVIAVDAVVIHFWNSAPVFFLASAIIQSLITKLTIGIYLYQLILIQQVDVSEPVVVAQQRLLSLKISSLWCARILFLQLPVWTMFYWNETMLENSNWLLWIIQAVITLLFTFLAAWLFININSKNKDKKWFRIVLNLKEWSPVIQSIALFEQVEEYNREENRKEAF